MNETFHKLLPQLLDAVIPLVLLLLSWASLELTRYLRRKRAEVETNAPLSYALTVAARLSDAAGAVVSDLAQNLAGELKEAARDGKLDAADVARLRRVAYEQVKAYLGEQAVADLQAAFGADALKTMIEAKIEQALLELKARQPMVAAVDLALPEYAREELPTKREGRSVPPAEAHR